MTINGYEIKHHRGEPQWNGDTGERWLIYNTKDKHPNCPMSSEMSWQDAWNAVMRMIIRANGCYIDKDGIIKKGEIKK